MGRPNNCDCRCDNPIIVDDPVGGPCGHFYSLINNNGEEEYIETSGDKFAKTSFYRSVGDQFFRNTYVGYADSSFNPSGFNNFFAENSGVHFDSRTFLPKHTLEDYTHLDCYPYSGISGNLNNFLGHKTFQANSEILDYSENFFYVVSGLLPTDALGHEIRIIAEVNNSYPQNTFEHFLISPPSLGCCCNEPEIPASSNFAWFITTGVIPLPTTYLIQNNGNCNNNCCDDAGTCLDLNIRFEQPLPSRYRDSWSLYDNFGIEFFIPQSQNGFTLLESFSHPSNPSGFPDGIYEFFTERLSDSTFIEIIEEKDVYIKNDQIRNYDAFTCFDGSPMPNPNFKDYTTVLELNCIPNGSLNWGLPIISNIPEYESCCQRFSQFPYGSGDGTNIDSSKPLYSLDFTKNTYDDLSQNYSSGTVLLYTACINNNITQWCNSLDSTSKVPNHILIHPSFEKFRYDDGYCDTDPSGRLSFRYEVSYFDADNKFLKSLTLGEFSNDTFPLDNFYSCNPQDIFDLTITAYEIDLTNCSLKSDLVSMIGHLKNTAFSAYPTLYEVLYSFSAVHSLPEHQIEINPSYFEDPNSPYFLEYHLINNSGLIPDVQHIYFSSRCKNKRDVYFHSVSGTFYFDLDYSMPNGDGHPYDFPFGVFSIPNGSNSDFLDEYNICSRCDDCQENDIDNIYLGLVISGVYSESRSSYYIENPLFACINRYKFSEPKDPFSPFDSQTNWTGCN